MSNAFPQPGGVVVGVDGSHEGYAATRYAAEEAARLGVRLHLVHVLPSDLPVPPEVLPEVSEWSLQGYGAELLERARSAVREARPDVEVETHLRSGARAQELLTCGEGARLIVLGSRSPKLFDRIWTGGTLTGVASSATCPVIVVPAGWERSPHRRIVVGVRSPGEATDLWEAAFPLAAARGAEIVGVHAWWLGGTYDAMIANQGVVERWQHERATLIEDELVGYRDSFPDVPVHVFVRHEEPAHALVRVSCGADLVLVQRPAAGRLAFRLGRVPRAVLRDARCPVMVLPEHREVVLTVSDERAESLVP
jgi:nucleotide-binding universal stress UspA family protein